MLSPYLKALQALEMIRRLPFAIKLRSEMAEVALVWVYLFLRALSFLLTALRGHMRCREVLKISSDYRLLPTHQ